MSKRGQPYQRVWERAGKTIPKGWHIHHLDGDRKNNNIDNLVCVTPEMHFAIHSALYDRYRSPKDWYACNRLANEIANPRKAEHPRKGKKWPEQSERVKQMWADGKFANKKKHPNTKEITINGVTYSSKREAARVLKISRNSMKKYEG